MEPGKTGSGRLADVLTVLPILQMKWVCHTVQAWYGAAPYQHDYELMK